MEGETQEHGIDGGYGLPQPALANEMLHELIGGAAANDEKSCTITQCPQCAGSRGQWRGY